MLKNLPSLKAKQLVRLLKSGGCKFYREGKGDHKLYVRYVEGKRGWRQLTWMRRSSRLPMYYEYSVNLDSAILRLKSC